MAQQYATQKFIKTRRKVRHKTIQATKMSTTDKPNKALSTLKNKVQSKDCTI